MQPLDHDMDELMRRAAADYPVKPHGMDWEKVAQQLNETAPGAAASTQHGGLKKLLLLLPFIFAGFVCDQFLIYRHGDLKKIETAKLSSYTNAKINSPEVAESIAIATRTQKIEKAIRLLNTQAQKQGASKPVVKNSLVSNTTFLNKEKKISERVSAPASYEQANLSLSNTSSQFNPEGMLGAPKAANTLHIAVTPQQIAEKSKPKKNNATEGKAYVSLLIGPDYSSVKGQHIKPAGYSVGALAGYRLTRKWVIEAGVLWDRKNYYSSGEYFKTDKIALPQDVKVTQVDGYCEMIEIPVNVRYTALQKRNNALFASGGVSSYLMHNENYDYVAQRYGVDYKGNADYKRASKNWASVINLGVGYEHQIASKTKIRIEPYLKLPIKGVGIGSLPLTSTGILLGVTHSFR